MPTPNKDESRNDFISRCVPIVFEEEGTKSTEHAVAKCGGIYDQHSNQETIVVHHTPGGHEHDQESHGGGGGGGRSDRAPSAAQPSKEFTAANDKWLARHSGGGDESLGEYVAGNKHGSIRGAASFIEEYGSNAKKGSMREGEGDNPHPKFTSDHDRWERRRINAKKNGKHARKIIKTIESGPNYEGRVYRGMHLDDDVVSSLIDSGVMETTSITSWTKDSGISDKFSGGERGWTFVGDFTGNINSADVSYSGGEKEVLSGKGRLGVTHVDRESRTIYVTDAGMATNKEQQAKIVRIKISDKGNRFVSDTMEVVTDDTHRNSSSTANRLVDDEGTRRRNNARRKAKKKTPRKKPNEGKSAPNVLAVDPTRTQMLRKRFYEETRRRLKRVRNAIIKLVAGEDAFGLRKKIKKNELTTNTRWAFLTQPQKVEAFKVWLEQQLALDVFDGTIGLAAAETPWWGQAYVEDAYMRGQSAAFDAVSKPALAKSMDFYEGSRAQFLKESFGQPVAVEKIELIAGRSFSDLKNITSQMSEQINRVLTEGMIAGTSPRQIARMMARQVDGISGTRARTIANTEIVRAHNEGNLDALERLGVDKVGVTVEWSTSKLGVTELGNPSPCSMCAPLHGIVLKISDAHGMLPRHPNCLLEDSLVTSGSWISAASKRWFNGDVVIIKTASGRKLTCTPNHPILTDKGWVPAKFLNRSSKVVCDAGSEWKRIDNSDYQNVPPTIHEVSESFFSSSKVSPMPVPLAAKDFHGDGIDGEIAVIGTYSSLIDSNYSSPFESTLNLPFEFANPELFGFSSFGSGNLNREIIDTPSPSSVSRFDLMSDLFGGSILPTKVGSFSTIPILDPIVSQSTIDNPSTDTEFLSKFIDRFSVDVFLDNVVHVDRRSVSCHVYNLETDWEWYTANGIITHNCRCSFKPAGVGESGKTKMRVLKGDKITTVERTQQRTKARIRKAIDSSIKAERPPGSKRTLAQQKKRSKWQGAGLRAKNAPKPPVKPKKVRNELTLHHSPGGHEHDQSSHAGGGFGSSLTPTYEPSMSRADAESWSKGTIYGNKTFWHGTSADVDDLMMDGFDARGDEANSHEGVSFSEEPGYASQYLGDGGNELVEVKVNIDSPLEVSPDFWQGTSSEESHQEVYEEFEKSTGRDRKSADVGELSLSAEEVGFDSWVATRSDGTISELRVFDPSNVVIIENTRNQRRTEELVFHHGDHETVRRVGGEVDVDDEELPDNEEVEGEVN